MPMNYYPQMQEKKPPMLIQSNAFLGDVATSVDAEKPITSGFYRLEKGNALEYHYTYEEMKLILEGSFTITDESGQSVLAKPGDCFYFPKGCTITFTTEDYGLAYFCGQRPMEQPL